MNASVIYSIVMMTLVLALAGCAPPLPNAAAPSSVQAAPVMPATLIEPAPSETSTAVKEVRLQQEETERLLSYFERLKRMPAAELSKEYEAARLVHTRAATDFNRISYAMTLALPGTAVNDDARALELLIPLIKKSENGLRPLVILLTTFIQERRRMGGDLAAAHQKLDALKSLERKLVDREQNNPGRKQ